MTQNNNGLANGEDLRARLEEIQAAQNEIADGLDTVEATYEAKQQRRRERRERLAELKDELLDVARSTYRTDRILARLAKLTRSTSRPSTNGHNTDHY